VTASVVSHVPDAITCVWVRNDAVTVWVRTEDGWWWTNI